MSLTHRRPDFAAIVLAAGQGTRMKSPLPKVLHPVAGTPMVSYPVRAALHCGAAKVVVVVGHAREQVEGFVAQRFDHRVITAVQSEQRGTGHATQCGLSALSDLQGDIVILYGDVPLIESEAIDALRAARAETGGPLAMLTMRLADPSGYGRIVREDGYVVAVREHRDCSPSELAIDEVNPGVYLCDAEFLRQALSSLSNDNAQGELYLTDIVARAARTSPGAAAIEWGAATLRGVNDRAHLAEVEAAMRRRINTDLARSGVSFRDLEHTYIEASVVVEPGVSIESMVTLRGQTRVASGARLDVGCVLTNVEVEAGAYLKPYTVATDSKIGSDAQIGPFSHLRPGSELGARVHVGNFVETKKTKMSEGSKANHLAYLGDGVIKEDVNVGAGTIFCNYDGFRKHTTTLERGAFIGSDSHLVAPVTVGENAYVATGTTVTKDVPAGALAVGRARQQNKEGYGTRLKRRLAIEADAAKKNAKG